MVRRRWIAVVLGTLATTGAAWGSVWCDLSAAGSLIDVSIVPLARGGRYAVSTDWTQPLGCDVGDSNPQTCLFCLRRVLFVQIAPDQWNQIAVAGPAQGWVRCNRTWTAPPIVDAWGNFLPGTYRLRTQIFQGGRCSQSISEKDLPFTVP
jgi:hypothetical protein